MQASTRARKHDARDSRHIRVHVHVKEAARHGERARPIRTDPTTSSSAQADGRRGGKGDGDGDARTEKRFEERECVCVSE